MRRLLLAIVLLSSCAQVSAPPLAPVPIPPRHIVIPLAVRDTDWICVETPPNIVHNYCVTMRELRLFVQPSVRAQP